MADTLETSPNKKRQNPPRIRKKNRFIFNDDEETDKVKLSSRKFQKSSKPRTNNHATLPVPEKKNAQGTSIKLRNILKLPKAHRWVCYEWFYSNIDGALFKGDNDLCICLRESFPRLKTKNLTRVEWCKIRRLMGKPRRLSASFFTEERAALCGARVKIRTLQQQKAIDFSNYQDLPKEIPLSLVIGTKVTARLRTPADGLFTGTIDAVDASNALYRITFDRQGVGTHSVPDYEVLSNGVQETMPLASFGQKFRPRNYLYSSPKFCSDPTSPQISNDPLMGDSSPLLKSGILDHESDRFTLGGFPVKFLKLMVRLSNILEIKREKIDELKELNTKAEKMKSFLESFPLEYQKRYASVVLELEKLNRDLNDYLLSVQQYCHEIAPEHGIQPYAELLFSRKQCDSQAEEMVESYCSDNPTVKNSQSLNLVTKLMSLMIQIKALGENDLNSFEFKSLSDSLAEIKTTVDPVNISSFQNNIEVHINYIQSGISELGSMHVFQDQMLR